MSERPPIPEGFTAVEAPPPVPEGFTEVAAPIDTPTERPPAPEGFTVVDPPIAEPSNVPRFYQAAWNRSITGLTQQILTGEKTFDISDEDLSTVEDIGATIASFVLTPDVFLNIASSPA